MGGSTSIPKRISCTHLLERASRLLVLTPLDVNAFSSAHWAYVRQSAAEAVTNRCLGVAAESCSFLSFSLSPAHQSPSLVTDNDEQPYLIIEEGTCYVDTNVYWLQLWLTVERGVDQYEDGSFDPDGLLAWQTARRLLDDLKVDNL